MKLPASSHFFSSNCFVLSTTILPSGLTAIPNRYSDTFAGPPVGVPMGVNLLPWQGQVIVSFLILIVHDLCVQTAVGANSLPSWRTMKNLLGLAHLSVTPSFAKSAAVPTSTCLGPVS